MLSGLQHEVYRHHLLPLRFRLCRRGCRSDGERHPVDRVAMHLQRRKNRPQPGVKGQSLHWCRWRRCSMSEGNSVDRSLLQMKEFNTFYSAWIEHSWLENVIRKLKSTEIKKFLILHNFYFLFLFWQRKIAKSPIQ